MSKEEQNQFIEELKEKGELKVPESKEAVKEEKPLSEMNAEELLKNVDEDPDFHEVIEGEEKDLKIEIDNVNEDTAKELIKDLKSDIVQDERSLFEVMLGVEEGMSQIAQVLINLSSAISKINDNKSDTLTPSFPMEKEYRKKPVVVKAWQTKEEMKIKTLEDNKDSFHYASPGDFIITGVKGEKYPCKPDIFKETYENMDGSEIEVNK